MTHQDPKKTDDQVIQQDNQFYGDQTISGQNPDPASDDNAADALEEVLGNTPEKPIGEEINQDEEELVDEVGVNEPSDQIKIEPIEDSTNIGLTGAAGASENLVEATDDPYESLTDADFGSKKK